MTRKLALVGIGKIARDQHIPAIAENPGFELVAVASRNATVDGVESFSDLATLLHARTDVDCVSLCTPPTARYGDAQLALLAGRHVMLEKPPGATLSEVHSLEELALARGLSLYATWHSRQAAAVEAAKDWIAERQITSVHIEWKEDVRHWHPGQDWIWQAGGLGVLDPGINALSILTHILPRAVFLRSAELAFPANRDTPVAVDMTFHDPEGAQVSASLDWLETGPPKWNITIETSDSTAVLSQGGARLSIDGQDLASGPDREYPRLYEQFAKLMSDNARDVDLAPMRHVADAFTLGQRRVTDPFEW